MNATLPKTCNRCGEVYRTIDEWYTMPLCGPPMFFVDDLVEFRNCPCGSTLALLIGMALDTSQDGKVVT